MTGTNEKSKMCNTCEHGRRGNGGQCGRCNNRELWEPLKEKEPECKGCMYYNRTYAESPCVVCTAKLCYRSDEQ